MHPNDADGMANSIDPDQTASSEAVWSWSALFAETYLSQYIEFVRYKFLTFCSLLSGHLLEKISWLSLVWFCIVCHLIFSPSHLVFRAGCAKWFVPFLILTFSTITKDNLCSNPAEFDMKVCDSLQLQIWLTLLHSECPKLCSECNRVKWNQKVPLTFGGGTYSHIIIRMYLKIQIFLPNQMDFYQKCQAVRKSFMKTDPVGWEKKKRN